MLRLFDSLETEPNNLFRDSYRDGGQALTQPEQKLLRQYRSLPLGGREAVRAVLETLWDYRQAQSSGLERREQETIPLYRTLAAVGAAAPVQGAEFDWIPVTEEMPRGAEFAVRITDDAMAPRMEDGDVVFVKREPLEDGDTGIFCVDGEILCRQYGRDAGGTVCLTCLNRTGKEAVLRLPSGGHTMICLGRVLLEKQS